MDAAEAALKEGKREDKEATEDLRKAGAALKDVDSKWEVIQYNEPHLIFLKSCQSIFIIKK